MVFAKCKLCANFLPWFGMVFALLARFMPKKAPEWAGGG
jgi:hypothetical protein